MEMKQQLLLQLGQADKLLVEREQIVEHRGMPFPDMDLRIFLRVVQHALMWVDDPLLESLSATEAHILFRRLIVHISPLQFLYRSIP